MVVVNPAQPSVSSRHAMTVEGSQPLVSTARRVSKSAWLQVEIVKSSVLSGVKVQNWQL